MKRIVLIRYLISQGCELFREGGSHSVYLNSLAFYIYVPVFAHPLSLDLNRSAPVFCSVTLPVFTKTLDNRNEERLPIFWLALFQLYAFHVPFHLYDVAEFQSFLKVVFA
jgi:hypothetical protein